MTWTIAHRLVAAAVAWSLSAPVAAAIMCGPHELVTSMLAEEYQERREAIGLSEAGLLMEVFVSPGGTWTILLTSPAGFACILAAGDNYEKAAPRVPEA
jgi:hypothetical protein